MAIFLEVRAPLWPPKALDISVIAALSTEDVDVGLSCTHNIKYEVGLHALKRVFARFHDRREISRLRSPTKYGEIQVGQRSNACPVRTSSNCSNIVAKVWRFWYAIDIDLKCLRLPSVLNDPNLTDALAEMIFGLDRDRKPDFAAMSFDLIAVVENLWSDTAQYEIRTSLPARSCGKSQAMASTRVGGRSKIILVELNKRDVGARIGTHSSLWSRRFSVSQQRQRSPGQSGCSPARQMQ